MLVVDHGRAVKRTVQIGYDNGSPAAITQGLRGGETLIKDVASSSSGQAVAEVTGS